MRSQAGAGYMQGHTCTCTSLLSELTITEEFYWSNIPNFKSYYTLYKPTVATDTKVFFHISSDSSMDIAGWYVNDGLLAAYSPQAMKKMVKDIEGSFEIQDLGDPSHLLGIQIIHN